MGVLPSSQGSVFSLNYRCSHSDFENGRKQDAPEMLLDEFKMQMILYRHSHTQLLFVYNYSWYLQQPLYWIKFELCLLIGHHFQGSLTSQDFLLSQHTHSQKENNIFVVFYTQNFMNLSIYFWRQKVVQVFRKQKSWFTRHMLISSSGSHGISAFRNGPCIINKVYTEERW